MTSFANALPPSLQFLSLSLSLPTFSLSLQSLSLCLYNLSLSVNLFPLSLPFSLSFSFLRNSCRSLLLSSSSSSLFEHNTIFHYTTFISLSLSLSLQISHNLLSPPPLSLSLSLSLSMFKFLRIYTLCLPLSFLLCPCNNHPIIYQNTPLKSGEH
jgi:hypothetical protein